MKTTSGGWRGRGPRSGVYGTPGGVLSPGPGFRIQRLIVIVRRQAAAGSLFSCDREGQAGDPFGDHLGSGYRGVGTISEVAQRRLSGPGRRGGLVDRGAIAQAAGDAIDAALRHVRTAGAGPGQPALVSIEQVFERVV